MAFCYLARKTYKYLKPIYFSSDDDDDDEQVIKPPSSPFLSASLDLALTLWIAGGFSHLLKIATEGPNPFPQAVFLCVVVWNVDTGALLFGKFFVWCMKDEQELRAAEAMQLKVFPFFAPLKRISPNKTIQGFCGGLSAGIFTSLLLPYFFPGFFSFIVDDNEFSEQMKKMAWSPLGIRTQHSFRCGCELSILAILGDLLESIVKRMAGVKDSGTFFPGHGGALDRMDSILLAGVWFYWMWFRAEERGDF